MRGLHHIQMRKRKAHELEPFPARSTFLRVLDRVVLVVGIVGPLTCIPQGLKIYLTQDATGVSVVAWALPGLFNIPWIMYGFLHKERPIVVTYTLWFVMNTLVVIGALQHGAGLS